MSTGAQSNWTLRYADQIGDLNSIAWTGSKLVASSSHDFSLLVSSDGVTWTMDSNLTTGGDGSGIPYVVWVGNQLIAMTSADSTLLTSPDGVTWTWRPTPDPGTTYTMSGGVSTGGKLVLVGWVGYVLTSSDGGATWASQNSGTANQLYSVVWTGTLLVAAGEAGTVLTSPDGVTWTSQNSGTANDLLSLVWTGTRLVAVGEAGTILTSSNGLSWTSQNSGTANDLFSVIWTGSQVVAVGGSGTVLSSPDGVAWTSWNSGTSYNLNSVVWTGSQLVAVGVQGAVLTSPQNSSALMAKNQTASSLSLRLTPSQLFVVLPNSMVGQSTHASIYRLKGDRLVESQGVNLDGDISLPIGSLTRGMYLLEVNGSNKRILQLFTVER